MSEQARSNIFLIGEEIEELPSSQLPTIRQVLSVCFNKQRLNVNFKSRKIASTVIDDVYMLWSKLNIPLREKKYSINQLERLRDKWRSLQKTKFRLNSAQKKKMKTVFNKTWTIFLT